MTAGKFYVVGLRAVESSVILAECRTEAKAQVVRDRLAKHLEDYESIVVEVARKDGDPCDVRAPKEYKPFRCPDCQRECPRKCPKQKRCAECSAIHRKEREQQRSRQRLRWRNGKLYAQELHS